jgi:hypothetical protein
VTSEERGMELLGRLLHIRQTAQKMVEGMSEIQQLFRKTKSNGPGAADFSKSMLDFLKAEMDMAHMITTNVDGFLNNQIPEGAQDDFQCGESRFHPGRLH